MEGNRRIEQDRATEEKLKSEIARTDREILKLAGRNGHDKKESQRLKKATQKPDQ